MYWESHLNQRYSRKLTYAPVFMECLDPPTMTAELVKRQLQHPNCDALVLSRDVTTYYKQEHLRVLVDCKRSLPRFFRIPYRTHLYTYTSIPVRGGSYPHVYAALCFVKEDFTQEW